MFFGGHAAEDDGDWEDQHQNTDEQTAPKTGEVNTTEFYELLQIAKDATTEQIKKAFRKRALKEHPDKGGDPNKFKRLKEAYDTLLDPEKRQLYDEYGEEGVKNGGPPGAGNFGKFWEPKDHGPKKTKPKLVNLDVTLEEIFTGTTKETTVKRLRVCTDCQGSGGKNAKECTACKGTGIGVKLHQLAPGMYTQVQAPCQTCNRLGVVMDEQDKCKGCNGKRVKEVQKKLEVAIQQGVPDSHDYIFYGESDEYPGVLAGDIYVRINIVKHQHYERKGADLFFHKQITLLEALTGVTTTIKHLDGKQYLIATSAGQILSNKQIKTIKRLGMPFYKDTMSFGNLHFEFKVVFPENHSLTNDQQALLRSAFGYSESNVNIASGKNTIPLEEFSQELLNPKAGIQNNDDQDDQGQQAEGQGIPCQQQ